MRSSRIARETSRLFSALSPRRNSKIIAENVDPEQNDVPEEHKTTSRKRKRDKTEPETTIKTEETTITHNSSRKSDKVPVRKARRQPAKRVKDEDGSVRIEAPANWEDIYSLTQEMRAQVLAPVDTMGCESLAEDQRSPRERRFQTLVALMLSSQTKDTVTAVAMKNLQEKLPGGFTLESILAVEPPVLNELISKVGFHNNKTKFIKATALLLVENHDSDIPDTIEGLIALPGVGPKMAYLCMSAAWGRDLGIGVDVHVHRITNLWGWHKTKTPEETRASLEAWLPREKWHDINHLLVGFGQTWCPPVGRKCEECKLADRGLCPSAVVRKTTKTKIKKQDVMIKDEDGLDMVDKVVEVEVKDEYVKAEDIDESQLDVPDIEDLGRKVTRRSTRSRA